MTVEDVDHAGGDWADNCGALGCFASVQCADTINPLELAIAIGCFDKRLLTRDPTGSRSLWNVTRHTRSSPKPWLVASVPASNPYSSPLGDT